MKQILFVVGFIINLIFTRNESSLDDLVHLCQSARHCLYFVGSQRCHPPAVQPRVTPQLFRSLLQHEQSSASAEATVTYKDSGVHLMGMLMAAVLALMMII